jgi:uncharacterized protein
MAASGDKQPSMEEILASIRRNIIEDEGNPPPAGTMSVPEPQLPPDEPFAQTAADVLDLTEPLPEPVSGPSLVSDATAAVTSQSLSALSTLTVRGYEGSDKTLEALVREMLQPMLKNWLDANLPEIVERMVSREIQRITSRP